MPAQPANADGQRPRQAALPEAIYPDWPAPASVRAVMSTRLGGVSAAPYDSLNLRLPDPAHPQPDTLTAVQENRRRFATALGAQPVWLRQVHGSAVLRLRAGDAEAAPALPPADACISTEAGVGCVVQVADCLPVLLCDRQGQVVGAAHAGWRGLAGGVLEATVAAMCQATGQQADALMAWLGPCIGLEAFEVGADVLQAFGQAPLPEDAEFFRYAPRPDGSHRWRADLVGLARQRLLKMGLQQVHGGQWCTVSAPSRFFSFRRQPVSGRLAAGICLSA